MSESAAITTEITEWAIQCHTRDGDLHTGNAYTSRMEAEQSGKRLTRINGVEWWLVSRRTAVTVERAEWESTAQPTADLPVEPEPDGGVA